MYGYSDIKVIIGLKILIEVKYFNYIHVLFIQYFYKIPFHKSVNSFATKVRMCVHACKCACMRVSVCVCVCNNFLEEYILSAKFIIKSIRK